MKTKPTYAGNMLTSELALLHDGTLFSEHVFDGLAHEPTLYKKIETTRDGKDIIIEPISFGQSRSKPTQSASGAGSDDLRSMEMSLALRAADEMARVCDDWVKRGIIDARSALADARLNYGAPFKYEWSQNAELCHRSEPVAVTKTQQG